MLIFLWVLDVRMHVLLTYKISIGSSVSIICISQEEKDFSLIASNQKIYDFYKWVTFEKKRHIGKYILDISELFIQCNIDSCRENITGGVNIYLHESVSLLAPECAVQKNSLFVKTQ